MRLDENTHLSSTEKAAMQASLFQLYANCVHELANTPSQTQTQTQTNPQQQQQQHVGQGEEDKLAEQPAYDAEPADDSHESVSAFDEVGDVAVSMMSHIRLGSRSDPRADGMSRIVTFMFVSLTCLFLPEGDHKPGIRFKFVRTRLLSYK